MSNGFKLLVIGCSVAVMVAAGVGMAVQANGIAELREAKAEPKKAVLPQVVVVEVVTEVVTEPEREYFNVPLSEGVQDAIFDECEKYGISPAIVVAMIERESRYIEGVVGDNGRSFGLMQIQERWHKQRMIDLNCNDLLDPVQNVKVGIDILAEQLDRYNGDMAKALTAYNRGHYSGTITEYAKRVLEIAERLEQTNE